MCWHTTAARPTVIATLSNETSIPRGTAIKSQPSDVALIVCLCSNVGRRNNKKRRKGGPEKESESSLLGKKIFV